MELVASFAHRVNFLKEGEESGSMQGQCSTRTRAKNPCDHLPLVPCCATESSAFFCPHHTRMPLLPSPLANTRSSCATENFQGTSLDVHFISSLPVKQQPACMAWVDKRPAQI